MNNQEFERKMNSIIEQQALFTAELDRRFAADLERRREREAEFDERHRVWKIGIEDILAQIARVMKEADDIVTRLARATKEGFNDVNAKINALVDAQIRTEDEQRKTDEQVRQTSEQLRRTDEWLRRHLGGKRNGGNDN